MGFKSQASSVVAVFLCLCSAGLFADEKIVDYEHFVGAYAFEATPYWPEFEIVEDSNGLMLQKPNSDWKMALMKSDGALVAKEDDGDEFILSFDSSKQQYIGSKQVLTSTGRGLKRFPERRGMVKLKPSPNDKLEKKYGVKAVDLVKKVRDSEDWIHQVKTFQAKAKDKWIKTPEGIEHRRKELQARFPEADISSKRFSDLRPKSEGELEVVFDDSRFRTYNYTKEGSMFLRIWDGQEYVVHEKYLTHEQEHYAFRKELRKTNNILIHFMWPRSKHHSFWWQKFKMENWQDFYGRAEEFILVGKQDYRGTSCYVVECYPKDYRRVRRWLVGVKDHLKYGDLTYEGGELSNEHWTGDYKEVKSGWWFPMTQGYHGFNRDKSRESFITFTRDIKVENVRVDEVLPDELFVMEFKDGVDVNDDRFGGFVTYKWKNDRTEEEWDEIRKKAQKRVDNDNAEKRELDERIGQTALEFPKECKWVNTEPLTMKKLRGKAVILQFWGIWCGPCHNYMGTLSAKSEDENVVVIGIHTPEDDLGKIKADMEKYKADGPVCVDVGDSWGTISAWYRAKRRPYWIAIGPDGKVLGHSDNPGEAFQLARKATEAASQKK